MSDKRLRQIISEMYSAIAERINADEELHNSVFYRVYTNEEIKSIASDNKPRRNISANLITDSKGNTIYEYHCIACASSVKTNQIIGNCCVCDARALETII